MRLLLLFMLFCAPAMWAADRDALASEVEDESVLDLITGKVERPIPEYWLAKFEKLQNSDVPQPRKDMELAEIEDQLNRQDNALERIARCLDDNTLNETTKLELYRLRAEIALNLWWMDGKPPFTPEVCLMIALDGAGIQPDGKYLKMVTYWARDAELKDAPSYVPDIFGLHAAQDEAHANRNRLASSELEDAETFLLERIRRHGAWENFDVMHALNVLYASQGKHHLAYFARLRAWELYQAGVRSRVKGAETIAEVEPLTVYLPIKIPSEDGRRLVDDQFTARRSYAREWQHARATFAAEQLRKGIPADSADFWKSFSAPALKFPPLKDTTEPPSADQGTDRPRTRTWVTLGVLAVLLVLGVLTKARISRSAAKVVEEPEANT